jgi:ubiquinone/menaquinone biosynthesis C-methylase UbiE
VQQPTSTSIAPETRDNLRSIYDKRFGKRVDPTRNQMWEVLCQHWMQRYVRPTDTVLDLAAGRCEFINNIHCGRKIAVDLNEDTPKYANADVEFILARSDDMAQVPENSIDVVFVSNFFEHLPNKRAFMDTLVEIKRVLKPGGKLLVLQPNIGVLHGAYWDFIDHHLPLTDRTLVEAVELLEMHVEEIKARFLPYTTKSRLPRWNWIIRLYLLLPPAQFIFGKQAWLVARK